MVTKFDICAHNSIMTLNEQAEYKEFAGTTITLVLR